MKNYLKFIVAVVAISCTTLGSVYETFARHDIDFTCPSGDDTCGYNRNGNPICGKLKVRDL